jgi:DNA-binding GntR family transcriptional regulator
MIESADRHPALPSSRAGWLARVLRERLLGGAFRPGEWIREATLREEFGVSNGPVREALHELIADGLLERVPYRGVRLIALDDRDVLELFQLRSAMMELAAELAARRRDPAAMARIPEILAYIDWSSQAPRPLTGTFTTWLAEASGSTRLARAWHDLYMQTQLYVTESRASEHFGTVVDHIKALIGAVAGGDTQSAREHARAFTQEQVAALGLEIDS